MSEATDERTFVYRIDAEDRIEFVNAEWLAFAGENGAPELTREKVLGRNLDGFIDGWETRHLYGIIYLKVRQTGRGMQFPFRCDSPDRRRFFTMRIAPQADGGLEFMVKVLGIEKRPPCPLPGISARPSPAFLVVCSWCKRIRVDTGWAEIEEATEALDLFGAVPPGLTHEICPDCYAAIRRQLAD